MNDSSIPRKTCPKCGTAYPATAEFFNRNKNCVDGLNGWCKACLKVWRAANREALLAKKHAYYEAHKDGEEFKRRKAESNGLGYTPGVPSGV